MATVRRMPLEQVSFVIRQVVDAHGQRQSCSFLVDGKAADETQPCEAGMSELMQALPKLSAAEHAAPFVLLSESRQSYAGQPEAARPDTGEARLVQQVVISFTIKPDGKAVDCRLVGSAVRPKSELLVPCASGTPFEMPDGHEGDDIKGTWTSSTWVRAARTTDGG